MVMKKSRAKSLWSWNSPLSIGFDVIFGLIPAVFFGICSGFGLFAAINLGLKSWEFVGLVILGIIGLIACYSLIHVTVTRGNSKSKFLFRNFIAVGLVSVVVVMIFALTIGFANFDVFLVLLLLISISIVAIKHIIMLSRAPSEVQP